MSKRRAAAKRGAVTRQVQREIAAEIAAQNELSTLIRKVERTFEGDSNDAEHDATVELIDHLKAQPTLTPEDWVEIYYALDYKLTSPAVGSDREGKRWAAHLRRILKTIGPDGTNMYTEDSNA